MILVRPSSTLDVAALVGTAVFLLVGVAAGVVTAGWTARAEEQRRAVAELEHGREVELQRAVAEERSRRAHDLHDTLAHAMTVVCLQAGAGQVPGHRSKDTVDVVLDTSRQALSELRNGLDHLGHGNALDPEQLRAEARRSGLRPEVVVAGEPESLPAAVRGLAARVTREALTNAGRYAPGARVVIDVAAGSQLQVAIRNEDTASASAGFRLGAGTGLTALAEEVSRSGGSLTWGSTPDGGWQVLATLPGSEVLV